MIVGWTDNTFASLTFYTNGFTSIAPVAICFFVDITIKITPVSNSCQKTPFAASGQLVSGACVTKKWIVQLTEIIRLGNPQKWQCRNIFTVITFYLVVAEFLAGCGHRCSSPSFWLCCAMGSAIADLGSFSHHISSEGLQRSKWKALSNT